MKELSILFVDSVNDSLLNNFKDEEQIKDYFEKRKKNLYKYYFC